MEEEMEAGERIKGASAMIVFSWFGPVQGPPHPSSPALCHHI